MGAYKCNVVTIMKMSAYIHRVLIFATKFVFARLQY